MSGACALATEARPACIQDRRHGPAPTLSNSDRVHYSPGRGRTRQMGVSQDHGSQKKRRVILRFCVPGLGAC